MGNSALYAHFSLFFSHPLKPRLADYGDTDLCSRILSNHSLPFFRSFIKSSSSQNSSYMPLADAMGVVSLTWAVSQSVNLV